MTTEPIEPFAYGIQAPIGSVTPLFHKLKDAEDYVAKLTDSRAEAKIIPLYRASPVVETVLETMKKLSTRGDELELEVLRLQEAIRRLADQDATLSVCNGSVTVTMDATLTNAERDFLQNLHGAYEELANQTGYVNAAAQKEAREHVVLLTGLLEKHK